MFASGLSKADAPAVVRPDRVVELDLLRGAVLVLMILDHVRGVWAPLQIRQMGVDWMATRWLAHFVAPTFVLLAGAAAYLYGVQLRDRARLARYLLTRGLWLVLLEFTVVHLGWNLTYFNGPAGTPPVHLEAGVIWAIGVSFVILAALVYLPTWVVAVLGAGIIVLHNLADGVHANSASLIGKVWIVLHEQNAFEVSSLVQFHVLYPALPWIGVMLAGYALGETQTQPVRRRRAMMFRLGLALIVAFLALRAVDVYGEPRQWRTTRALELTGQSASIAAVGRAAAAFVDCTKYPPSLLFLLMTLGPVLAVYPSLPRLPGALRELLLTFGRVPLFFYLIHLPFIAITAAGYYQFVHGLNRWFGGSRETVPLDAIPPLWLVYGVWIATTLVLYPMCIWFAHVKAQRKHVWLKYL